MIDWDDLAILVRSITGMDLDKKGLRQIAANVSNAARWFNIREGVTRIDDKLPKRFYQEALGRNKKVLREEDLNRMLDEYYDSRGWDSQGNPPPLPDI